MAIRLTPKKHGQPDADNLEIPTLQQLKKLERTALANYIRAKLIFRLDSLVEAGHTTGDAIALAEADINYMLTLLDEDVRIRVSIEADVEFPSYNTITWKTYKLGSNHLKGGRTVIGTESEGDEEEATTTFIN